MPQVLVTGPVNEPVDVGEVRDHLRVEYSGDDVQDELWDTQIALLITAARKDVENFLGRKLITQTWDLYLDAWPAEIELPFPPLRSVSSVAYKASDYGTTPTYTTLAATEYIVDSVGSPGRIVLAYGKTWPTLYAEIQAIKIRFSCGYGDDATHVPENIRQAILMRVADLYEHRGDSAAESEAVWLAIERLLGSERMDFPV